MVLCVVLMPSGSACGSDGGCSTCGSDSMFFLMACVLMVCVLTACGSTCVSDGVCSDGVCSTLGSDGVWV